MRKPTDQTEVMIRRKAFKLRLNMNPELEETFFQCLGCCRFVWNKALSLNLERLKNKESIMYYNELDCPSFGSRVKNMVFSRVVPAAA